MLILLDIDGTLTPAMGTIEPDTVHALEEARDRGWSIGVVGGSDRAKAVRQLGEPVLDELMEIAFHENGCTVYRQGRLVHTDALEDFLTNPQITELLEFLLHLVATAACPWRTGNFIERRQCMLNVSPIGRACSASDREAFFVWDQETRCRLGMAEAIRERFPHLPIEVEIGGQISLDIFPRGLDKRRCLAHLGEWTGEIHFIGDRCERGGNDHHLYHDPRVIGHRTTGPDHTREILRHITG